ncbi:aminofutalosine synthase MqnE [Desulfonatronovibrio hydrogenovorans]|uniref:aminofutalosine synthase MqnE n=1 Tax=Desulfonatronovibrio hydrogenovorans TaxID=53245 RepID=UPI00048D03E3|nr:aminofutalosine synthase MqnE [Desulfonatronovibrio hydrogenovorans]
MNSSYPVIKKVLDSKRINREEALELAFSASIHDLGQAAHDVRTRLYGDKAFFVYNQHLNFTNICANACRFCAFSKKNGQEGAFTMSIAQVEDAVRSRITEPIDEIHVVGGLNPELEYGYYLDMLKAVRRLRPDAGIKAFTAVEIAFLADKYGYSVEKILADFAGAGLDALPGGGAEVFSPELRQKLCPEKVSAQRWLDIHETAHKMSIPTNCTLLFGHVETWEDRIDHLLALRELQDRTGGFLCFIPLAYQPGHNDLKATGPDGIDFFKMTAVSRIVLDNIPHIKAYWAFSGIKAAQLGLWFGADDFDGTIVEEKIGHAAGADTPKGLTIERLKACIKAAGFDPGQRDSFFQRPLRLRIS